MHNCNNIKDIILTDYVDNEIDTSVKVQVEKHLQGCLSCQAFAREVKAQLVVPLQQATRQEVPSQMWNNIQNQIIQQQQSSEGLLVKLQSWLSLPRLVPTLVSLAMVVIVTSTLFFDDQKVKQARDQEIGSYLTYVMDSQESSAGENNNLGTSIESYFL